jgi:class 3 adenylate cyclase
MRGEPVRGALPEPGFFSLTGFEQVEAIRRGLVPRSPLAHLVGLAVTQAGPGRATLTVPASAWLDWGDGLDVAILAEAAISTAVRSGAPGGMDVRTAAMSVTPFRAATLDANKLIAHARTIRDAHRFTYAEAAVEDDLGREVARVTGAVVLRPREPPPPPAPVSLTPFEEPAYPTPDPYLRRLPPDVGPVMPDQWARHDGLALVRSLIAGEPAIPIHRLLDLRMSEANSGRTIGAAVQASEWFTDLDRIVAPGVVARVALQALTGAATTALPIRSRLGVVNVTITFVRPVPSDGRELVAEGHLIQCYDDSIVAMATVTDADGAVVATAHETAVRLPPRPRAAALAEPVIATVLFTDLAGSTAQARRLGDEEWRRLLAEHHDEIRRQLQAFAGREIKTTGDGFLATFDSPARAVRCAAAVRNAMKRLGLDVKVGVHTGECQFAEGDVTGIAVHIAARVLEQAAPSEILASGTVRDLLLGSGLSFSDRGRHELKGLDGDWQLFALED